MHASSTSGCEGRLRRTSLAPAQGTAALGRLQVVGQADERGRRDGRLDDTSPSHLVIGRAAGNGVRATIPRPSSIRSV